MVRTFNCGGPEHAAITFGCCPDPQAAELHFHVMGHAVRTGGVGANKVRGGGGGAAETFSLAIQKHYNPQEARDNHHLPATNDKLDGRLDEHLDDSALENGPKGPGVDARRSSC